MRGRRVLVTGMGGELGALTTSLLEREPWVGELAGLDVDPPRRRLRRALFHRVEPTDESRIAALVAELDPHVLLHLGVYEPGARATDAEADRWTAAVVAAVVAGAGPSLEHVVVRSGTTIYGAAGHRGGTPDESAPVAPVTRFGHSLAHVEERLADFGRGARASVGVVRLAPVIGPHVPSPLGRVLRLPAVPVPPCGRAPFQVVWDHDAANALVAAARVGLDGPVNVAAPGSITTFHAVRRGRRIPVPIVGPQWQLARVIAGLAGAPVPDHVLDLMRHGRLCDASRAADRLGVAPVEPTPDVIAHLYAWPSVVRRSPEAEAA